MENNKKKRIISVGIILFIIIVLVSGGTLAYWSWQTADEQKTEVTLTISQYFSCAADGGGNITAQDAFIAPSSCTNSQHAIKREIKAMPNIFGNNPVINMELYLDVNTLDSGLSNSQNFRYALTTSSTSCTDGVIESGNFNGKVTGNKVLILDKDYTQTMTDTYYLYIWLDGAETSQSTMNQNFSLSLSGKCEEITPPLPKPEAPVLDDGMIPVKIANNGTVTTVSSTDLTWYNYDNKEWANAVLVKNSGTQLRSYYKNNTNVTIPEEDILAYYVWIPRYKYKIWTVDATTTTEPQTIGIEFEPKEAAPVLGTTVDSWKTHPAFIWDGETVAGLWVGKFETGHSTLSSSKTNDNLSCTDENCANADGLIIKPNVVSLRYNSVSNQFYASRSMSRSSNPFGLSSSITNTHMMKNSEWGAVAYFSHSKYGINEEIRINNNSSYTTGCGASAENGSYVLSCQIAYGGATSYPQSTTGNITGVFDMSGGAHEYVMGNYNSTISSAGFTTMPSSKYYDVYSITSNSSCTIEECGGHALFETAGWYSDTQVFVSALYPWFRRGGSLGDGSAAGAWGSDIYNGNAFLDYGFRSVAIVGA